MRRQRRTFSPTREVATGLATYGGYLLVRAVVVSSGGRLRARRNAERLYRLERRLGIAVEPALQQRALRSEHVLRAATAGYAVLNVGLTIGWLVRMFVRSDPDYHRLRRAAVLAHAGALPVFLLLPTAPPRTLDGFVDTLETSSGIDLEHPFLVRFYNPIAAMPSQHLSFAVVTAGLLGDRASTVPGRLAAHAYPPLVALVVVATGNHFVLDVVAGAALGVLARRLA